MASSQVEIASSSPFDCVLLRDHNGRGRDRRSRESNVRASQSVAFQKKKSVRDHFHSSSPKNSDSAPNENSQNHDIDNADFWVGQEQRRNDKNKNKMKTDGWARAREMVSWRRPSSRLQRENSPAESDCSIETEMPYVGGGVSSLVQRWRDMTEASNYGYVENACESIIDEAPSTEPEDSESERRSPSPCSDGGESERLRVSDIIRKLASANQSQDRDLMSWNDDHEPVAVLNQNQASEQGFLQVISSPRIIIRGRQALRDLLMHMERDRHTELQALARRRTVSTFSQRGRIQALLRLRLLRRQTKVGDHQRSNSVTHGSNITLLRERFNTRIEHDASNLKSTRREVVNNSVKMCREDIHDEEIKKHITSQVEKWVSCTKEEKAGPSSGTIRKGTDYDYEVRNVDSQESSNVFKENLNAEEQDTNNQQQVVGINHDRTSDIPQPRSDYEEEEQLLIGADHDRTSETWEEQESNDRQQLIGVDQDRISDISYPRSDWEEHEANHDWISDISRPQSDWEGLRQARYQEMLDPYLDNQEIRKLLHRRSVSTFLSSNLRETIDQLMISRIGRQPHPIGIQQEEEEEGMNQLMIPRQTHQMCRDQDQEQEEDDDVVDEEQEEERPIGYQYNEVSDYCDEATSSMQLSLPSLSRSWSHNHHHQVSDDSNQVASPSLQQPLSSQSSYNPSIEVEPIHDLRGHMEQLHHEMSELRRSIKSCINMQVKFQRSIKEEIAAAVSHSVGGEGKESLNGASRKRSCCVCYEMQVDSLLYRCGHMCTCFKCARDLQWSTGKCPICRTPIVDVVRTYIDS
uniref:RING-type domain-containing protein n=2 Tax=Davidia involucrata TaxID=16924 RepID=A0A5B6YL05_DAVIN